MTRGELWITFAAGFASHGYSPMAVAEYADLLIQEYDRRYTIGGYPQIVVRVGVVGQNAAPETNHDLF